jgi:hypothetical protein
MEREGVGLRHADDFADTHRVACWQALAWH